MDEETNEIEQKIDCWLYDLLPENIPRNKYIYHCNIAYIDIVIDQKMLFTPFEKHYLFSLTYNTHIAHKKLREEESFDYSIDEELYKIAFNMIIRGMQYSMLCDVFPLLHAGKAELKYDNHEIYFETKNIPRKHYKFISDYSIRKYLSYTLQMECGRMQTHNDEDIAMKLADRYMHFWNENMLYEDYEPYSRLDWGGINFFFTVGSMRRFNKLYKKDFNITSLGIGEMMILLSPEGVKELRNWVPATSEELYQEALQDNIYKPLGKGLFPKLSISDAPLNKTKDGFIFANPLVLLFNDSAETRFLNYTRKCHNSRYLRIKDKIKERVIPLIEEMIKYKLPGTICISNFNVKIPHQKKNKRECDLLLIDSSGIAIYLEIKHFYYPQSFCETKKVDEELNKALDKMPDQLDAIRDNWEILKSTYKIQCDLKEIHGIIVSHRYLGYDVPISEITPIVSSPTLYESIAESNTLYEVYKGCREVDEIYPNIKFLSRELVSDFAGYKFHLNVECLEPAFEINFIEICKNRAYRELSLNAPQSFQSIKDLAKAYIDQMNN